MGAFGAEAVQFRGAVGVKRAFENIGIVNWALFNGKTLLEKYEGEDEQGSRSLFEQYIDALDEYGSKSVYRLQTYDDLKPPIKIRPSTEPDRSFQFILHERDGGAGSTYRDKQDKLDQILHKMEAIESKIAILESDDDEGQVSGIGSTLGKLMEMPAVQQKIAAIFEGLVDKIMPAKTTPVHYMEPTQQQPAALNGVPSAAEDDQAQKINQAIVGLWECDKQLGDHLLRLLSIAKKSPSQYNNLVSMLKSMT